jgi:hypothetical protein
MLGLPTLIRASRVADAVGPAWQWKNVEVRIQLKNSLLNKDTICPEMGHVSPMVGNLTLAHAAWT